VGDIILFQMKLKVEFGNTWNRLKNSSNWGDIRNDLLVRISNELMGTISSTAAAGWKRPTGLADQSWYTTVNKGGGYAIIGNRQPYMYWANFGVVAHQMRYLLNVGEKMYLAFGKYPYWGKKFIPVRTETGTTVFRRCTEKSIRAGGWWNPGYPAKNFVRDGIDIYKNTVLKQTYHDVLLRGGALRR